jgi:hypothetical protein
VEKSRHVRLNAILRRKIVKKFFLVFLVLLAGMAGLSAAPLRPGGGNDAPLMVMPQGDMAVSIAASGVPAPMRPGGVFVSAQESAFTQDLELICLWFEQYREGLLTADEFKTLAAGRVAVMYMRDQAGIERMRSLAEKMRQKADPLFMYRELDLGIQMPISLALAGFSLLC